MCVMQPTSLFWALLHFMSTVYFLNSGELFALRCSYFLGGLDRVLHNRVSMSQIYDIDPYTYSHAINRNEQI